MALVKVDFLKAADELANQNISAEVIDLRTRFRGNIAEIIIPAAITMNGGF